MKVLSIVGARPQFIKTGIVLCAEKNGKKFLKSS
jgi:UDP-N-acetylglucosamine 2-epimerase